MTFVGEAHRQQVWLTMVIHNGKTSLVENEWLVMTGWGTDNS